jgi:hypothetical protein
MADIRIKDLPDGAFIAGQKVGLDSDAIGTRKVDVQNVIDGVLGNIHTLPDGTFTSGEKLATDSLPNGARRIDVQDIVNAYDAAIAAALAGYLQTVDNGLVENVAGNARLGGALVQNTTVGAGGSGFFIQLLADALQFIADNDVTITSLAGDVVVDASVALKLLGSTTPSIGDVLTATAADGSAQWQALSGVQTADNGLTEAAGNVQLGGNLIQPTLIGQPVSGQSYGVTADSVTMTTDGAPGYLLQTAAGPIKFVPNGVFPTVGQVWKATAVDGSGTWGAENYPPASYGEGQILTGAPGDALVIPVAGTFEPVTTALQGEVRGAPYITFVDAAAPQGDHLLIGAEGAGVYVTRVYANFNVDSNALVTLAGRVNEVAAPELMGSVRRVGGTDPVSLTLTSIATLPATARVSFAFTSDTNGTNLGIEYLNGSIFRIA